MESKGFRTPEEEIAYLRTQLQEREKALRTAAPETTPAQVDAEGREVLRRYAAQPDAAMLAPERMPTFSVSTDRAAAIEVAADPVAEVFSIFTHEGVKRGLAILEKHNDPHLTDAVHARLLEELRAGIVVPDMKEGGPHWEALHMSLFEVSISREKIEGAQSAVEQIQSMMRFFAGMQGLGYGGRTVYYTLELAVAEGGNDIVFYVSVPTVSAALFEKQTLSLFPQASITFQPHDYNIFVEGGCRACCGCKA